MVVDVEDGRIRRLEAHPDNRATLEGICLKGLSYYERVYSPDRILHPLRKNADTGELEQISWDEALDLIAQKLQQFRSESGPQSVLYYAGSGTKGLLNGVGLEFWRLYGGCTTTYGDLCWPAGLEATRLTLGDNKHSAPWDIADARLIVMWGKNASETNIHQMTFVEQALDGGAKLVVIDPRRTQTSERAELLIQPRPGTDGALALAIAGLLIDNSWIDVRFIAEHVRGFERFSDVARAMTPEMASEITDVPTHYIHRLAELIGTYGPVTISPGFGMQRYTNSGQTMRSILALLAITGNIGKPGAGWVYANLQSQIFEEVKDPIACYPPGFSTAQTSRTEAAGNSTVDAAAGNGAVQATDPVRVSISTALLGQQMLAAADPSLRMAWVERGNPVTQNPETHTVLEAFRSLEFVVVIDQFLTDTAREADLVLPAKTMFEQSDVIGAYWHPYIQLKQKLIEPLGEVKPESEVYYLLARKLGFGEEALAGKIPGPTDDDIESFLEEKLAPFEGLSLEKLREGPMLPPDHQEVAFSDHLFPTPSGKIELYSEEAAARWDVAPVPTYREPVESSRVQESGAVADPPEPATTSAEAARYPLYLMTPNTKNRIHSQFNNLQMIRQFGDQPFVFMNPDDAAIREIRDGARVEIFNDRGSLRLEARMENGLKAGCVAVTNGWWISEGGTVNFCSHGRETDMGHGAAFHDNMVEVRCMSASVEEP